MNVFASLNVATDFRFILYPQISENHIHKSLHNDEVNRPKSNDS